MAKGISYTTPIGILGFSNLEAPKPFKDKQGREKGEPKFDCMITWEPKVLKQVKKDVAEIMAKLGDHGPGIPWYTDKKTSTEYLKASAGKDYRPGVYDGKKNDIPPSVAIGRGTKARINVTISPYEMGTGGIKAYLNAVQIVELVERGAKAAFGELEGGYVYEGGEDETRPEANASDLADF